MSMMGVEFDWILPLLSLKLFYLKVTYFGYIVYFIDKSDKRMQIVRILLDIVKVA
jgi:hypothetical protein